MGDRFYNHMYTTKYFQEGQGVLRLTADLGLSRSFSTELSY